MEKKSILMILIVVILIVTVGFLSFNQFTNSENHVAVGDATFILPEGFYKGTPNNSGDINITNGYDTLFLKVYNDSNMTKHAKEYSTNKHKQNNNSVVKFKNFTVGDVLVCKATVVNESSTVHYWFDYHGKTYSIYTWSASNKIDNIVTDLIKSIN